MPFKVRFTQTVKDDIERFYTFLAEQDVIAAQHTLTMYYQGDRPTQVVSIYLQKSIKQ